MNTRDLALRALIVRHIADVTSAAIKARRGDLSGEMANGDRVTVTSPEDPEIELGQVWRTKPKGTAAVTDRPAFLAWMADTYPDRTEQTERVRGDHWVEALDVLREHAPHLLETVTTVTDWAEAEVLRCTEKARQACGPGGELDVPGVAYEPPGPGVVTVRLSTDGPTAIEQLWRDGRIDLTTGEVLALPAPTGEPR